MKDVLATGLACLAVMALVVSVAEWWQTAGLALAGLVIVSYVGWMSFRRG